MPKSFEDFQTALEDERKKAAVDFLTQIAKIPELPDCEVIHGKLMFSYDDGTNLLIDLTLARDIDPQRMAEIEKYYKNLRSEDDN